MSFYEQNQQQLKVPTITQTMEVDEQAQPQHQVPSSSTTQIAYSTTSFPDQEDYGTLLATVYGVNVNGDQENPSNSEDLDRNDNFNDFPPGIRFRPTDSELIIYYLSPKLEKKEIPSVPIRDVNLYEHSPDKIAERYQELKEGEGYFFTPRNRKYPNGNRPNRATDGGYWKATGADKPIVNNGKTIGLKKTLVYYEGEAKGGKGIKTNWIMHEYCLLHKKREKRSEIDMRLDDFVLSRVYKKGNKSFQSQQSVKAQGLRSEVDDAYGNGSPQGQENTEWFGDIDHSSEFGNAYGNNFQNSQLEFCNIENEVALAGFDDFHIPIDDPYSMLNMDNPYTPSGGFFM